MVGAGGVGLEGAALVPPLSPPPPPPHPPINNPTTIATTHLIGFAILDSRTPVIAYLSTAERRHAAAAFSAMRRHCSRPTAYHR